MYEDHLQPHKANVFQFKRVDVKYFRRLYIYIIAKERKDIVHVYKCVYRLYSDILCTGV